MFTAFLKKVLWWCVPLVGWVFANISFLLPVRRLRETESLLAFHHPQPAYPFHVLLMPKRAIATLKDIHPADGVFLSDLYATVQSLVDEFHLSAYRLIVNGGDFQEFPHLHFHLISPAASVTSGETPA